MMDMNIIKLEKVENLSLKLEKECLLQKNCEIFVKEKKMISQQQCLKTENYEDDFTTSSDENNSLSTAFSPLLSENQSDIRMESSQKQETQLDTDENVAEDTEDTAADAEAVEQNKKKQLKILKSFHQ
ncbi:hypothetical protein PPERSA_03270 [Pseudocohnilembus persalinus]|uniref:Uncharacterized protein n=1 Tax=Pseudocohnilembus persalinus TaxID=266149 RepID=A0A0V0QZE8_PSEPJ|nr:hypothetical protein PPERSA_03270 [Pseudocohnilembus persalinus]|eukprot:KRX07437.1 hypothetical protein PPERSA_03270 [Pseudocohnilembus persalinus]